MSAPASIATAEDATRQAEANTLLSPRFYTTDFKAMDRIDVGLVRREWDALVAEFERDVNRDHFERTAQFDCRSAGAAGSAAPGVPRLSHQLA